MKMKKHFVGRESYDPEQVGQLCGRDEVKGIVLGDLFCQKRMFRNGIADLVLLTDQVLSSGKTVIYQAPLYVTSRNADEVASVLNLMDGYGKESYVIVQDFGTAEMAACDCSNIRLIWGQLGRVRERRYSDDFLLFLKEKGFTGMETGDPDFAERLRSFGLVPFFNTAVLQYQTLGRICYVEYQTGRCDPGLCHTGCLSLRAEHEEFEMTVDGYMLGKKYRPVPEQTLREICAGQNAELIVRENINETGE